MINRCSGYKTDVWNVIKTTFLYFSICVLVLDNNSKNGLK